NTVSYLELSEGAHTLRVRVFDAGGNLLASRSRTWTVDLTPPTVSISAQPPVYFGSTSATFNFAGTDNLTPANALAFQYSLDGPPFAAASGSITFNGLAQGAHTFQVRAVDLAGNISSVASYTWTADTVAPAASITAQPPAFSSSATAVFSFAGTDNLTPVTS